MRVTVVGAGVIGLTSAAWLARADHDVTVVTALDPLTTTSAVAAASFKPRMVPVDRMARRLLTRSARLMADQWHWQRQILAVAPLRHVEADFVPMAMPWYLPHMADVVELTAPHRLLPGHLAHGVAYRTWLFDVPRALDSLLADLADRGVALRRAVVTGLAPSRDEVLAATRPEAVVNAAGVGAGRLAGRDDVVPVRGQVLVVARRATTLRSSLSADGTYVYPRRDELVIGGTAERGQRDRTPRAEISRRLLADARRFVPGLDGMAGGRALVGIRPWRPGGIRCELQVDTDVPVVHAYGHGGAGWTLAPGTAQWVAAQVTGLD